jgi:hypothetical protein
MAKQHRMALATTALVLGYWLGGWVLVPALATMLLGTLLTSARRALAIHHHLESAAATGEANRIDPV